MVAELVARETENGEVFGVLGLKVLVELLEAFKLGGEATLGGGVHDKNDLAVERGEGEGSSLLCEESADLFQIDDRA